MKYHLATWGTQLLPVAPWALRLFFREPYELMQRFIRETKWGSEIPQSAIDRAVISQIKLRLNGYGAFPNHPDEVWQSQVRWEGLEAYQESLRTSSHGVILVSDSVLNSRTVGAITRLSSQHPSGSLLLGFPRKNQTNNNPHSPIILARNYLLAKRALKEGQIVLAAGNTIGSTGRSHSVNILGHRVAFPTGWALLAEETQSPVWFAFPATNPLTIRFVPAPVLRKGPSQERSHSLVESFARQWAQCLRHSPEIARSKWVQRWLNAPRASDPESNDPIAAAKPKSS